MNAAERKRQAAAAASKDAPPLRLEYRSAEELSENPQNWRRHPAAQLRALGDVLAEVGWAGAALFNERTGRLIDGHARKRLAQMKGQKVPVLVGNWSEEDERKILATLDPIGAMAETDDVALKALTAEVDTESDALKALMNEDATGGAGGGGRMAVKEFEVLPPPKMAWVLVGIPLDKYGEVIEHVVALQQVAGVTFQTSR